MLNWGTTEVFGAIGHTADDTQSTTVKALGSCPDRAHITPNGCDSSKPSSHVPSYQCIIMVHVLIGKISGGGMRGRSVPGAILSQDRAIASAQSSVGLAVSILTVQDYFWLELVCQPIF